MSETIGWYQLAGIGITQQQLEHDDEPIPSRSSQYRKGRSSAVAALSEHVECELYAKRESDRAEQDKWKSEVKRQANQRKTKQSPKRALKQRMKQKICGTIINRAQIAKPEHLIVFQKQSADARRGLATSQNKQICELSIA